MKIKLRTTFLLVVMLFALSSLAVYAETPRAALSEEPAPTLTGENSNIAEVTDAASFYSAISNDAIDTIVITADIELTYDDDIYNGTNLNKSVTVTDDGKTQHTISIKNTTGFSFFTTNAGSIIVTIKGTESGGLVFTSNSNSMYDSLFHVRSNDTISVQGNVSVSNYVLDSTNNGAAFSVEQNGTLKLDGTNISGCSCGDYNGGAIYSLGTINLNNVTINNCSAKNGGGVYTKGPATFSNVTIKDCTATGNGSCISVTGNSCIINSGTYSGEIRVANESQAYIEGGIINCSFSKNSKATISISGGWFPAKVTDYIADGYFATDARSDTPDAAAPYTVMKNLGLNRTNNLNLSSDLKFGFYINNYDSTDVSSLSVKFTMAGSETTVTGSGFVSAGDNRYYAVYEGVSPQFIGTDVTAELYKDGTLVDTFTRSILDYAKALYTLDTAKYGTLVSDLVDYGIAADAYAAAKGYNRGTGYTRSGCEWLTAEASTGVPAQGVTKSSGTESLDFVSANVIFDAENKLRLRVRMPSDGTLTVSGDCTMAGPVAIEGSSGEYYYYLTLKASQYTDMYDFTLKYGEDTVTLNYGLGAYAYSKYNGADGVMKDLALATYRYGLSAKNAAA